MRFLVIVLACLLSACGGASGPVGPSPMPAPTRIAGTITDTLSSAQVGTFSSEAASFPAKVSISASGYVTRETWVRSASPTVDLIAESGFSLDFYRQFARGSLDGSVQPLRMLSQAPSIYLQTAGLTAANVAALEAAARSVVPALTGGRFQVQAWDAGADVRAPSNGWIVVDLVNDDATNCGRALIGAPAGHVWLNRASRCSFDSYSPTALAHELGHALGFWHVPATDALMFANPAYGRAAPSDLERHHAAIAYHRNSGNLDVDTDPAAPAALHAIVID